MHKFEVSQAALDRGRFNRDGRDYSLTDLNMSRVAHIVVDLQNGFMAEGSVSEVPVAREIVGNVNALSKAVRNAGGLNVFLRYTYDKDEKRPWNNWYKTMLGKPFSEGLQEAFTPGHEMHEIWPGIDIAEGEPVLNKTRFSGFIAGTCDLDEVLQKHGIETVIITGTVTNCCSEATARDAQQLGYNVIFVADGNAAMNDDEHNGTLASMHAVYADVMDTAHILDLIKTASKAAA